VDRVGCGQFDGDRVGMGLHARSSPCQSLLSTTYAHITSSNYLRHHPEHQYSAASAANAVMKEVKEM